MRLTNMMTNLEFQNIISNDILDEWSHEELLLDLHDEYPELREFEAEPDWIEDCVEPSPEPIQPREEPAPSVELPPRVKVVKPRIRVVKPSYGNSGRREVPVFSQFDTHELFDRIPGI